ncbi:hypothetical protein [Streptococcus intermedius]|uniref:hypothetical protein n=1 Tax=Streptococcus intermedius TaxID=1338 RepID=UPI000F661E5B|nr:hypothetical protein [Streptococcus intermedius]MDK8090708.1 hypothetical protein [Streptococcus intermedius]RSJ21696.1 hypothetical protein D8828_06455 [Streptococcus intermedius]
MARISNEILGLIFILSYIGLLCCLWIWIGPIFLLLCMIFWGLPLLIISIPWLGLWIFTRFKSLVLIGYLASLLNGYYLLLIFKAFHLERIMDTAGHSIPLSPWLFVAIIAFDGLFLSVSTLGFYKNLILALFKKEDLDNELP